MNAPNAEKDEHDEDPEAIKARQHQQKLTMLNLFRLLETAVQTSQFKVGGQIVVHAQEIVGLIKSARTSFEENSLKAVLELNQAAESYRHKVVRWEAEARAAQAGQRQLTQAQKRQLPAEIPTVRAASRKTHIFFERLVTSLAEWSRTVDAGQESAGEPDDADAGTTRRESIYERDRAAYAPEPEVKRKTSLSAEGLTMMTMMVRQQFEEIGNLFRGAQDRDVDDPIQSAFAAFSEGHYQTARSRLKLAHETFLQAASTRRIAHAEIAEERFETLLQGTGKLAEAANQQREMISVEHGMTRQPARKAASDPVQDLRRLQKIMQNALDKVFPPGSSKEHRKTASSCMKLIVSGPLSELPENLRSLLRLTNYGADNNASETREAKEIIKRLAAHSPEEIRPPRDAAARSRNLTPVAGTEPDEDGITLDFEMTSTKCLTVDPVDIREARLLELEFRNSSTEPARLQVQVYNNADKPILSRPVQVHLPATKEANRHTSDVAEKIDPCIDNTLAVTVEFIDLPEHVEITKANFTGG